MRTALLAATLCALLSGCGQKGPLFIPDDHATTDGKGASNFAAQPSSQPQATQP